MTRVEWLLEQFSRRSCDVLYRELSVGLLERRDDLHKDLLAIGGSVPARREEIEIELCRNLCHRDGRRLTNCHPSNPSVEHLPANVLDQEGIAARLLDYPSDRRLGEGQRALTDFDWAEYRLARLLLRETVEHQSVEHAFGVGPRLVQV